MATILLVAGGLAHLIDAPALITSGLLAACYAAGGWQAALSGLRALRQRVLDVDLLMVAAALGAAAIGQVLDGALLIVIFATSGALEAAATQRTTNSVRSLLTLTPERATLWREQGGEQVVDVADLAVGDVVVVRPGERIAADGEVSHGVSEVDEASVTGEPLPVRKQPGDRVFAGTSNGTGALRVRITGPPAAWVMARIVAQVERASQTKAARQLFIESVETRYSVGMVAATVLLFVVPLMAGSALQPTLLRAMTFMIVASPCAVVLATMPPLLSAIANAGRHGVLVKSAVVMEQLGLVNRAVFDKTGTLTEGLPEVTHVRVAPGADLTEEAVLALAATAERPSEHPLGRALVTAATAAGLAVGDPNNFRAIPGRGVTATVDGHAVTVGAADRADAHRRAASMINELQICGDTVVTVTVDGTVVGVIGLADRLRATAVNAVAALAQTTGQSPVLVTGDHPSSAARIAARTAISDVRGGLLPADKVTEIHRLQRDGEHVMVVGDGINDAPALAAADVGVAVGRGGADLALDTADAVIVGDDLSSLPPVLALSRRARRVVAANLAIAATAIMVLVTWDLVGQLPLPLAVAGHEGSTVLVALNGARLLRRRAWTA